ncbi:MAG: hypothetical protein K2H99_04860 [Paramuribaculum sp.]|nr:hypothetical protein [Paramuribaculum sp.]
MGKRIRRKLSTSTRYKMSLAKQGTKNPMAGKHHSESTCKKISQALKEYWRLIPLE